MNIKMTMADLFSFDQSQAKTRVLPESNASLPASSISEKPLMQLPRSASPGATSSPPQPQGTHLADLAVPTCAPIAETILATHQELYDYTPDANAKSCHRNSWLVYWWPRPDHSSEIKNKNRDSYKTLLSTRPVRWTSNVCAISFYYEVELQCREIYLHQFQSTCKLFLWVFFGCLSEPFAYIPNDLKWIKQNIMDWNIFVIFLMFNIQIWILKLDAMHNCAVPIAVLTSGCAHVGPSTWVWACVHALVFWQESGHKEKKQKSKNKIALGPMTVMLHLCLNSINQWVSSDSIRPATTIQICCSLAFESQSIICKTFGKLA